MKKPLYKLCYRALIPLFCATGINSQAWAEIVCDVVHADATLSILSPVGPTVGIANFVIGGEPSVASVIVNLMAPPEVNPDGSQSIMSRLDYDFGGGDTVVGVAIGTLTPSDIPGVYTNASQVTYIDGTGKYENVVSRIISDGTANFLDNTATQTGVGDICTSNIDLSDDDYSAETD